MILQHTHTHRDGWDEVVNNNNRSYDIQVLEQVVKTKCMKKY